MQHCSCNSWSGRRLWHCECFLNSPQNRHQCATAAAAEAAEAATRWNFATRPRFEDRLDEGRRRKRRGAIHSPKKCLKIWKIYLATSRASSCRRLIVDRRSPIDYDDRRSIMISSSIFNEFARARRIDKKADKQSISRSLFIWERQQLKVKEKTTIACPVPAHDRAQTGWGDAWPNFAF